MTKNHFKKFIEGLYKQQLEGEDNSILCKDTVNFLLQENKRLKEEISIYHEIVNCDNCDFHSWDEFENIDGSYDSFEVCDRGHTEELINNRFCQDWHEF